MAESPTPMSRDEWVALLSAIHAKMGTAVVMEELFFQRRAPYAPLFEAATEENAIVASEAAQQIDLAVAAEALTGKGMAADATTYQMLFGKTYLGSPLSTGALAAAAAAWPEVERLRYRVAMASALHYDDYEDEEK